MSFNNNWSTNFSKELNLSNVPTSCSTSPSSTSSYSKTNSAVNNALKQRQKNATYINSAFKGGASSHYQTTQPLCKPGYTAYNVGSGAGSEHNISLQKHASTLNNWNATQKSSGGGRMRKRKSIKRKRTRNKRKRLRKKIKSLKYIYKKRPRLHSRRKNINGGKLKKRSVSWGCFS